MPIHGRMYGLERDARKGSAFLGAAAFAAAAATARIGRPVARTRSRLRARPLHAHLHGMKAAVGWSRGRKAEHEVVIEIGHRARERRREVGIVDARRTARLLGDRSQHRFVICGLGMRVERVHRHAIAVRRVDDGARLRRPESFADEDERFARLRLIAEPRARAIAAPPTRPARASPRPSSDRGS